MKIIGQTNHIVYPRRYFIPEDENNMENEKLCWCLGVDQNDSPIMFRINMNIEKVKYDEELKKYKPVIGENARFSSKNKEKEMPAIWNFFDEGERNFFCAAFEDNNKNYSSEGGVILISKCISIDPINIEEIKKEFKNIYNEELPKAKYYECGYARVLNQGVPEEASKKIKIKMKDIVAKPLYGIGRLEMSVKKPNEKSVLYALSNQFPEKFRNQAKAKEHYNQFRKKIQEYKKVKQDPTEENKIRKKELLDELNLFEGVESMRNHSMKNRYFAEWGKTVGEIDSLRKLLINNPNDEKIKEDIIDLKIKADNLAIESEIADFKMKIFHPEDIISTTLNPNDLSEKIDVFYKKYTIEGSYGGVFLRVLDPKGRSIPALGMNFQCKYLGPQKPVSKAMDDVNFAMTTDKWKQIQYYVNKGLKFELVPFSMIKTPGPGKNSYKKIANAWIGNNISTSLRDLYLDPVNNEYKNTYVVGIRRRNKKQKDSAFLVEVIATGYDGEAPCENTITKDGNTGVKIRNKNNQK